MVKGGFIVVEIIKSIHSKVLKEKIILRVSSFLNFPMKFDPFPTDFIIQQVS